MKQITVIYGALLITGLMATLILMLLSTTLSLNIEEITIGRIVHLEYHSSVQMLHPRY